MATPPNNPLTPQLPGSTPPTPAPGEGTVDTSHAVQPTPGGLSSAPMFQQGGSVPLAPSQPLPPGQIMQPGQAVQPGVAPQQVMAPQQLAPQQVVPQQPVAPQQQVTMQPVVAPQQPVVQPQQGIIPEPSDEPLPEELLIYSHSTLFYWWPVWVVGYLMALITWMWGVPVPVNENTEVIMHSSKNLGVLFTLTFFLVILITNVTVRGMSSVVVILSMIVIALTLAYFQLWDVVLNAVGRLEIYMNLGFYVFFSSAVFVVWAFSFFFYDRLQYWRIRPGQVTQEKVIGGAERSYDTRGMVFEKHQEDLFRHWILGLGSGDIQMITTGARRETIDIPNVLFVNHKLHLVQRLIAMKPTDSNT